MSVWYQAVHTVDDHGRVRLVFALPSSAITVCWRVSLDLNLTHGFSRHCGYPIPPSFPRSHATIIWTGGIIIREEVHDPGMPSAHDFGLQLTITRMGAQNERWPTGSFSWLNFSHLQADFSFGVFTLGWFWKYRQDKPTSLISVHGW